MTELILIGSLALAALGIYGEHASRPQLRKRLMQARSWAEVMQIVGPIDVNTIDAREKADSELLQHLGTLAVKAGVWSSEDVQEILNGPQVGLR